MTDEMLPPWKMFPYPWGSLGYRMGEGEDYWWDFIEWYENLADIEKTAYQKRHPEPWGWRDYYQFLEQGLDSPMRGAKRGLRLNRDLLLWGLGFWPVLFALGFANGALRELVMAPLIGGEAALPVSGLTLLVLTVVAIRRFMIRAPRPFFGEVLSSLPWSVPTLGLLWVALTVGAEYLLFAGIMDRPVAEVTASFTPSALIEGNLFLLVLITVAVAPSIFYLRMNRTLARNRARYCG